MNHVLFLCSANYYRSRFAEHMFNYLAQENNLDWRAESRGIVAQSSFNPGRIAQATRQGLAARNIHLDDPRYPLQLTEEDLVNSDHIVALYEPEHRPMVSSYFAPWENKIEYWLVPDLDELDAASALALIEQKVQTLINSLEQAQERKGS